MANYTNEELAAIAKETFNTIKAGLESQWVYFSWGVSKMYYTEYEGMPTLMLRVSGVYHKGWVFVSLNEGVDYYEVRLMDVHKQLKKGTEPFTDIFCEDLGNLIDRLVERGMTSEEEYRKLAAQDTNRKLAQAQ